MEMAAAYTAMAADVKKVSPFGIRDIRGQSRRLYEHTATRIKRQDATLPWKRPEMLDLLITTVDRGTGKAGRMPFPVAGKTGTTQEYRDAWFVGFTADIVAAIWLGNDDNTPTDRVSGGDLPARIWHDFMTAAYQLETVPQSDNKDLMAKLPAPEAATTPATAPETTAADTPQAEPQPAPKSSFFGEVRGWFRSLVD
jgi:membrane peptidoglycan carboxypeptidase